LVKLDEGVAQRQLEVILKRIEELKNFPNTGTPIIISEDNVLRQVNVGGYRIFYVVDEDEDFVEVHGVEHMKQDSKFRA